MNRIFLCVMILFISEASVAESDQVDLLWKARGLQGDEWIKSKRTKKLTDEEKCEYVLEAAYAGIADPEISKAVTSKEGKENQYSLFFSPEVVNPNDKSGTTTIIFSYPKGDSKASSWGVNQLGKNWYGGEMRDGGGTDAIIGNNDCIYLFDLDRPFKILSLPRKKSGKK